MALVGLIGGVVGAFVSLLTNEVGAAIIALIFVPLLYAGLGFVFGYIIGLFINLGLKFSKGVKLDITEDVAPKDAGQ